MYRLALACAWLALGCTGSLTTRSPLPIGPTADGGTPSPNPQFYDGGDGVDAPAPPLPPSGPEGLASGLAVSGVSVFQTLEVPLGGTPTVPIYASKPTRVRIAVQADAAFMPANVRAVVEVSGPSGVTSFEQTRAVTGSSTPGARDTYFHLDLPSAVVAIGSAIQVRLLSPGGAPTTTASHPASWPIGGVPHSLGAQPAPRLRVKLVAMRHAQSTRNAQTQLTPERIEKVRQTLVAMYPIADDTLELTVRDQPVVVNANAGSEEYLGFTLDQLAAVHQSDGAPLEQVYFGFVSADWEAFPCDTCSAIGLAYGSDRAEFLAMGEPLVGVGIFGDDWDDTDQFSGFTEEDWAYYAELAGVPPDVYRAQGGSSSYDQALNTMVHEIGHTLTLNHAPCTGVDQMGNFLDTTFPRQDGSILYEGFDTRKDRYLSGMHSKDVMSYCELVWISDHNYRKLAEIIPLTSMRTRAFAGHARVPHIRALVSEGIGHYTGTIDLPPADANHSARFVPVTVRDSNGRVLDQVMGRWRGMRSDRELASLYIPIVEGGARYEMRRVGGPTIIDVPRGPR